MKIDTTIIYLLFYIYFGIKEVEDACSYFHFYLLINNIVCFCFCFFEWMGGGCQIIRKFAIWCFVKTKTDNEINECKNQNIFEIISINKMAN